MFQSDIQVDEVTKKNICFISQIIITFKQLKQWCTSEICMESLIKILPTKSRYDYI